MAKASKTSPPARVTVEPVPGRFLLGVPSVVTTTDPQTARALVESGAFRYPRPDPEKE